jgi:hypothetical protein
MPVGPALALAAPEQRRSGQPVQRVTFQDQPSVRQRFVATSKAQA